MKKLLLLLSIFTFLACSSEEDEEICCDSTIAELREFHEEKYTTLLENDQLSEEQRRLIEKEYQNAQDDPCGHYKESMAKAGAECGPVM